MECYRGWDIDVEVSSLTKLYHGQITIPIDFPMGHNIPSRILVNTVGKFSEEDAILSAKEQVDKFIERKEI